MNKSGFVIKLLQYFLKIDILIGKIVKTFFIILFLFKIILKSKNKVYFLINLEILNELIQTLLYD